MPAVATDRPSTAVRKWLRAWMTAISSSCRAGVVSIRRAPFFSRISLSQGSQEFPRAGQTAMFWPDREETPGPKRGWRPMTSATEAASMARTGPSLRDVKSRSRDSLGRQGPIFLMTSSVTAMGTLTITTGQAAARDA